jgi:LytS/YehU family sensor histidine kinase
MALINYKLSIAYRDSLFNEENTKKTVSLQMQYEFDKKEAETKAAQMKKDLLTQTEIQKQKSLRNNIATAGGIIITASIFSFLFYRRKREAQMQADISAARIKTMTAQLDKHFVFGSLSSVKNLIEESPEKATELITRSSKFLRTTLNLSESTIITLKQELDATENYLQIEKINHDDKFDFKVTIEEGIPIRQVMVPPLIFQPIVENSIQYGFNGIDYKGQIDIQINKAGSQLICKIADNGIGFQPKKDADHKSFGTKLTKERLELYNKLHKQKALFTIEPLTQGVLVTLTLPLHTA